MFDISWGEMIVVGVVALLVIGPKELPGVIRAVGRSIAKLRTMAGEFRGQFDEAMREAELQDVKKSFDDIKDTATGLATSTLDPLRDQFKDSIDTIKGQVADATGASAASETLGAIEADAKALEAEVNLEKPVTAEPLAAAVQPVEASPEAPAEEAPAKPKRSKKTVAGDAA